MWWTTDVSWWSYDKNVNMANSSIIICIDYAKLIRSNEIDGWDEGKNPFCRGLNWDEYGIDAILCRWALYGCKEDIILFSDGSLLVFPCWGIEWKGSCQVQVLKDVAYEYEMDGIIA